MYRELDTLNMVSLYFLSPSPLFFDPFTPSWRRLVSDAWVSDTDESLSEFEGASEIPNVRLRGER